MVFGEGQQIIGISDGDDDSDGDGDSDDDGDIDSDSDGDGWICDDHKIRCWRSLSYWRPLVHVYPHHQKKEYNSKRQY